MNKAVQDKMITEDEWMPESVKVEDISRVGSASHLKSAGIGSSFISTLTDGHFTY